MQKVTSTVDFAFRATQNGKTYDGTARGTENWSCPDGPVDRTSILNMHKEMWLDFMGKQGIRVHHESLRMTNVQILVGR